MENNGREGFQTYESKAFYYTKLSSDQISNSNFNRRVNMEHLGQNHEGQWMLAGMLMLFVNDKIGLKTKQRLHVSEYRSQ